jgi:hypothetical protein
VREEASWFWQLGNVRRASERPTVGTLSYRLPVGLNAPRLNTLSLGSAQSPWTTTSATARPEILGVLGERGAFSFPPQPTKVKPHVFWSVFHVKKENNRWPSKALVKVTHRPALICWPPLNNSRRRDIVDTKDFHLRRFDVEESCSRFGGSCWWLVSNKRCDHQASTFGAGDPPRYIVFYLGFSLFFYLDILTSNPPLKCTKSMDPPFFSKSAMGLKNLK